MVRAGTTPAEAGPCKDRNRRAHPARTQARRKWRAERAATCGIEAPNKLCLLLVLDKNDKEVKKAQMLEKSASECQGSQVRIPAGGSTNCSVLGGGMRSFFFFFFFFFFLDLSQVVIVLAPELEDDKLRAPHMRSRLPGCQRDELVKVAKSRRARRQPPWCHGHDKEGGGHGWQRDCGGADGQRHAGERGHLSVGVEGERHAVEQSER